MPRQVRHTYFFGRIYIYTAQENRKEVLINSLRSRLKVTIGKFRYGFFDIVEYGDGDDRYVCGRLVKYKEILEGEAVDEAQSEIIDDDRRGGIVGKSAFCIHYRSLVIAYRPIPGKISEHQFRTAFRTLVEAANNHFFFDAGIETIQEEVEIIDALTRFDIVHRVSFEIHPTNPSNRQIYKSIDDKLKRLGAEKLQQTVESKSGLNKAELLKDDTHGALTMASDGYGKAEVAGILDGKPAVITTNDSPVRHSINGTDDSDKVLEQLQPAIQSVLGRIR